MRRMPAGAFTLIELLVSVALVVVIAVIATIASVQMLAVTHRLQLIQAMDGAAASAQVKLGGEVSSMHPCAALWLISSKANRSVEFIFMRSKYPRLDNQTLNLMPGCSDYLHATDMLWTRWYWSADSGELAVSTNRSVRWTRVSAGQARNYWNIIGGSKMPADYYTTFLSVPRLQHDTGPAGSPNDPVALLDSNRWDTGEATDVGDYKDLELNTRPILGNCSAVSISLQNLDGTTRVADGLSDLRWGVPGSYIDGRMQGNLPDRPGIVRLRLTMTAQTDYGKTEVSSTYSFSFSTSTFAAY